MQAGVVPKKICFTDFNCTACRFNRAMNRVSMENKMLQQKNITLTGPRAKFEFWVDRLRKKPASQRPCVHTMKGRIGFKSCPKSYQCNDCEFDLFFHDQFKVHTVIKPVGFDDINGVALPKGYYLHPGHTWVKLEGQNMVRVGIDDFACRLLGFFDGVTAPLTGKQVTRGNPLVSLTREKNEVVFPSPVTGVVTEVNTVVRKKPDAVNRSPYTDGWVFLIYCPDLKTDLRHLMFMADCNDFIAAQVDRLYDYIEEKTQVKAADGGLLVPDIFGNLPGVSYKELVDEFILKEV